VVLGQGLLVSLTSYEDGEIRVDVHLAELRILE